MRINKEQHQKIMLNILADISANPELSVNLGFKGGTCCYFLHGLDRFSVDLDFDLLNENKKDSVSEKMEELLLKYDHNRLHINTPPTPLKRGIGTMEPAEKALSYRLKYSDDPEASGLKIEISDRIDLNKLNRYEVLDVVSGVPLNVLSKRDIFAHKLVALKDRFENKKINKTVANRDLYDICFFFQEGWDFNEDIIKLRRGIVAKEYLKELKKFIENNANEKNILNGIGALVDDKKRDWVKNNLKKEVIKQLAIQIKAME